MPCGVDLSGRGRGQWRLRLHNHRRRRQGLGGSRSLRVRKGTAVLSIGKPIPVAGMRYDDRNRLLEETQGAVAELRNHARQRLREQGQEPGGRD